jgi:hypothetical protein
MKNAVPVKVGKGDIPDRRLLAFGAVLSDLDNREIDPEYLDLRFAEQVVVKPRANMETNTELEPAPPAIAKPAISKPAPKKKTTVKKPGKSVTGKAGNKGRRSRHGRHT